MSLEDLTDPICSLNPCILERENAKVMLRSDIQARCRSVNRQDREAWEKIDSREDWENFCGPRIRALRRSLGTVPTVPANLDEHVTGAISGDGYRIENLVYKSRDGVYVTANLYMPSSPHGKMPVIIIVHSHHNPKTQGELQDMGMIWARSGCMVLVMDQLSYGERRQHSSGSRQDYRFRYINGIQLYLIGDSLMGWMVWDVMRGIDLVMSRRGVDKEKIILMGSVAGGGDVAAVTAALDERVACAIPFNFGGPQPETEYPLPEDAEKTFNYMGYGYWESTRNLRLSGRDGFLPWVIVASVAPRRLIYAHEFSWDEARDPVWKRLQKVYNFYGASDNLAFAHGAGLLSGRPPEATHCNNVGQVHRSMIYPALERWFGIPSPQEYQDRLPAEKLMCLKPELNIKPLPLHEIFADIGVSRADAMRESIVKLSPGEKRQRLRQEWEKLLGNLEPYAEPAVKSCVPQNLGRVVVERIALEVDHNIVVPLMLLIPSSETKVEFPVVVAVAQGGKAGFLKERCDEIAKLLREGIAVCLTDVRGTGETQPGGSRERQSESTSVSATELMLGQTLLGSQLKDLRSVLWYLRRRSGLDAQRIALWGDSFAPVNPPGFSDPLIDDGEPPRQSEPVGGLLALLGALYEEEVCAVAVRGMMAGYQSVLSERFCYFPYDAVIPGVLTAGDLCDVALALVPLPLRLEALVDGRNCLVPDHDLRGFFELILKAYNAVPDRLFLKSTCTDDLAVWLSEAREVT